MKIFRLQSKHLNDNGYVALATYIDGSIAIRLINEFGEPLSVPTVNLQDHDETPRDGCVFIKDYAENEGVYDTLHSNGIVGEKMRTIKFGPGDAKAYECALTLDRKDAQLL